MEGKSLDLVTEMIDMFKPHDGTVPDAYAGTLSTEIASMSTGSGCVEIEKDASGFIEDLERLLGTAMGKTITSDDGTGVGTYIDLYSILTTDTDSDLIGTGVIGSD